MSPSQQFLDAATFLSHASALSSVSNAVKLELYGLFKYITVSPAPSTSKPSIFDMAGRAKWDSWTATGNKYTDSLEAERRYIEIAKDLGWSESTKPEPVVKEQEQETEEIDWDDDDPGPSRGAPGGLAVNVSSMARPDDTVDDSIHGLAVSNDVTGLKRLLEEHPDTDLNARDEYGFTPLHLAADRGSGDTLHVLLERGADPSIQDEDGLSPLELAKVAGHVQVVEKLETAIKNQ